MMEEIEIYPNKLFLFVFFLMQKCVKRIDMSNFLLYSYIHGAYLCISFTVTPAVTKLLHF